jgi:hypothetical protein
MFHGAVPTGAFSALSFDATLTISERVRQIVAIGTVSVIFVTSRHQDETMA